MGKASKWFRSILGLKKPDPHNQPSPASKLPHKDKRRWSFVKSYRQKYSKNSTRNGKSKLDSSLNGRQQQQKHSVSVVERKGECEVVDPNKQAIFVAAAKATVSKATIAAAQAAAAVVRLPSNSAREPKAYISSNEELAAVKIQSAFRGYMARRALRAIKGLVRLQALVRGHMVRKRSAECLRRMQALLRAQARARSGWGQISESSKSNCKYANILTDE